MLLKSTGRMESSLTGVRELRRRQVWGKGKVTDDPARPPSAPAPPAPLPPPATPPPPPLLLSLTPTNSITSSRKASSGWQRRAAATWNTTCGGLKFGAWEMIGLVWG